MSPEPEMYWHGIGDIMGQNCTQRAERGGGECGGAMTVLSIDGQTDFDWNEPQPKVKEGMCLDLELQCINCDDIFDGALYYDDLWPVDA